MESQRLKGEIAIVTDQTQALVKRLHSLLRKKVPMWRSLIFMTRRALKGPGLR